MSEKTKEETLKDIEEKTLSADKPKESEDVKTPKKKKQSSKKTKKKEEAKKEEIELSTLVELVDSLEDKENIFLRLSMNNYFNQYMDEKEYRRKGYVIAPYINVEEFNEKMKK